MFGICIPRSRRSSGTLCGRRRFLIGICLAITLHASQPRGQLRQGEWVVTATNAYKVQVRSQPEVREDTLLAQVFGGTQLKFLGRHDDWYKVQLPDGQQGWLYHKFGRVDFARDQLEVIASVARIRIKNTLESETVARAIEGLMLDILGKEEDWYQVRLPDGQQGWVFEGLVRLQTVAPADPENTKEAAYLTPSPETSAEINPDPRTRPEGSDREATLAEAAADVQLPGGNRGYPSARSDDSESVSALQQLEQPGEEVLGKSSAADLDSGPPSSTISGQSGDPESLSSLELSAQAAEPELPMSSAAELDSDSSSMPTSFLTGALTGLATSLIIVGLAALKRRQNGSAPNEAALNGGNLHLLRVIRETDQKLEKVDHAIEQCLRAFREQHSSQKPSGAAYREDLSRKLDEIKQTVLDEQEQMSRYLELITLQNEKLSTLEQENASIRRLLDPEMTLEPRIS